MNCICIETTNQGKQYCQECMPDEFHWLVPVSKEPDPFLMDRNHAYIDPNNIIYVLSRDRVRAIKITTSEGNIDLSPYALKEELASKISELTTKLTEGLEGAKYFEGEGIRIDEDNRIHSTVNLTEVNQRLDSLEQVDTSPYKAGTGIEITPDLTINSTVDVSGLDSRVQTLEEKEDKDTTYTAGAGLSLNNNIFSLKAKSSYLGLGFTYTNPFITIGFIDQVEEDANTGTLAHTVSFSAINGTKCKNTLIINPINLSIYKYPSELTATAGKFTFPVLAHTSENFYNSATSGKVLIVTEILV